MRFLLISVPRHHNVSQKIFKCHKNFRENKRSKKNLEIIKK